MLDDCNSAQLELSHLSRKGGKCLSETLDSPEAIPAYSEERCWARIPVNSGNALQIGPCADRRHAGVRQKISVAHPPAGWK